MLTPSRRAMRRRGDTDEFARCATNSFDEMPCDPRGESEFALLDAEAAALRGRSRAAELRSIAHALHAAPRVDTPKRGGAAALEIRYRLRTTTTQPRAPAPAPAQPDAPARPPHDRAAQDPRPIQMDWLGQSVERIRFAVSVDSLGGNLASLPSPHAASSSQHIHVRKSPLSSRFLQSRSIHDASDAVDDAHGRSGDLDASDDDDYESDDEFHGGDHTMATPKPRFVGQRGGVSLRHAFGEAVLHEQGGSQVHRSPLAEVRQQIRCASTGAAAAASPAPTAHTQRTGEGR